MQAKNQFSRRQIRIKIFQLVYGIGWSEEMGQDDYRKLFIKNASQTEHSFTALALFIVKLFEYSLIQANKESSKFVQANVSEVDTDIARMSFIEGLKNNTSLSQSLKDNAMQHLFAEEDLIKKTFTHFKNSEEYQHYVVNKESAKAIENLVLRAVEYTVDQDQLAYSFFEEKFINWEDDIEIISRWVSLLIKHPDEMVFQKTLTEEKIDFAEELLQTYYDKYQYLNELIKPKLKNWDADRVALVDTILLRLGLSELLYFPSIPVKVSINEYIDIAKLYSTEQSGQFVNGVLDNLRKELEKQNLLRKLS